MEEESPVLKHLLERRNVRQPKDGRKIVLAHFGGLMVSARGAGALTAFEELGLTDAFDEIYTMSSGFANASYFLAGKMQSGAAAYYRELSGFKFLKPYRFWNPGDLEYFLDVVKHKRPLDLEKLFASRTKLYTMVVKVPDIQNGIFLELHDFQPEEYFDLLRACSTLPVIQRGHVALREGYYRDVFYNNALTHFMEKILARGFTDLIVLYNYDWQRSFIHSTVKMPQENVYEFTPKFFVGRPTWLQKLARLEIRSKVLRRQAQEFGNEVKRALGSAEPVGLE